MFNSFSDLTRYRVAAIDLANTVGHLVIASPYTDANGYNQIKLEKFCFFDDNNQLKANLSKERVQLLSYLTNSSETLTETSPVISATNLAHQKRNCRINEETFISDYFNFAHNSILCGLDIEASRGIYNTLQTITPHSTNLINSSEIALTYLYNRLYAGSIDHNNTNNNCTAIINFGSEHLSIIVINKSSPVCIGSLPLKAENHIADPIGIAITLLQEAKKLFQTSVSNSSNSNTSVSNVSNVSNTSDYNLVLLAGECTSSDLDALRTELLSPEVNVKATTIEFFNPLTYGFINIDFLPDHEREEIVSNVHKYTNVLAGTAITLDYAGVDLSPSQHPLVKSFSNTVSFYTPQNYLVKTVDFAVTAARKVRYAVASQTSILLIALVLSLALIGYNYYQTNQELLSTEKNISEEKNKLDGLKDVKSQFQHYQAKVKVKNERIQTIQNIQLNQLTVPTILAHLQNAQRPIINAMKFNTVEIADRNINVTGESIDKLETITFLKKLSDTGVFVDLNPVYDSNDLLKCKYNLTSNYTGPIRANSIPLPINSDLQPVQPVQINPVSQSSQVSLNTSKSEN